MKKLLLAALTLSALSLTTNNVQAADPITEHQDNPSSPIIDAIYKNIDYSGAGGAISTTISTSITNSTFSYNKATSAGGAIDLCTAEGESSEIINSNFDNNYSGWSGGAVTQRRNAGSLKISGGSYTNNTAKYEGGALFLGADASVTSSINNVLFEGNKTESTDYSDRYTTKDDGGGGAIFVGSKALVDVSNATFNKNTSNTVGGAIAVRNDSQNNGSNSLTVSNSTFTGNEARLDGGAIASFIDFTVSDAKFEDNTAGRNGGAISIDFGNPNTKGSQGSKITGGSFANNYATENGGAIYTTGLLSIDGTTFTNNGSKTVTTEATGESEATSTTYTTQYGGAIYNAYTAPNEESIALLTAEDEANEGTSSNNVLASEIKDATFTGNTASYGGAVFNEGDLTISTSTFGGKNTGDGNSAAQGGAIYNNHGTLTLGANNNFISNSANYGGAIINWSTLDIAEGNTFTGNNATYSGGAIYNAGTIGSAEKAATGTFANNKAAYGGAIYNAAGTVTLADSTFTGNTATYGGAIRNDAGATLNISGTTFGGTNTGDGNSANFGGAIYNMATGVVTLADSTFIGNSATASGGAIYNNGTIDTNEKSTSLTFSNNQAKWGGAIYNSAAGVITLTDATFTGNSATNNGGAIYNSGTIGSAVKAATGTFTNNKATYGGAIYNTANMTLADSTFTGNTATGNGGAILNAKNSNLTISDSTFGGSNEGNSNKAVQGGAIQNEGKLTLNAGNTFTSNSASFGGAILNFSDLEIAEKNTFTSNIATVSGGAIYNNGTIGTSEKPATGLTFTDNQAAYGGAIYNDTKGELNISDSKFTKNTANIGGAIYSTNTITVNGSEFTNNGKDDVYGWGGAIYIKSGAADSSIQSTITDTIFSQNHNTTWKEDTKPGEYVDGAFGGAIAVETGNLSVSGSVTQNDDNTSTYTTQFNSNKSDQGGAIGIALSDAAKVKVSGVLFDSNEASFNGGAIVNYGTVDIENSTFTNNKASTVSTSEKFGGGALFVGSNSETTIKGSTFSNNTALTGGAIAGRDTNQSNAGAILRIEESVFDSNEATGNGGAIANTFSNTTVTGTTFTGNKAGGLGGAIYNDGADSKGLLSNIKLATSTFDSNKATSGGAIYNNGDLAITDTSFTNNTATENGGAIFSNTDLTIAAATKNVVFSGNKAVDGADIYMNTTTNEDGSKNTPNLALNAANKKSITLDGGISGNEKYNLNINNGSNTGSVIVKAEIKNATTSVANGTLQLDKGASLNNTSIAMQSGSTLNVNTALALDDANNAFVSNGATLNLAANTTAKNATLTNTIINATNESNSTFDLVADSSITSATLAENTSLTLNSANDLTIGSVTGEDKTSSKLNLNQYDTSTGKVSITSAINNTAIDIKYGELLLANNALSDSSTLNIGSATLNTINSSIETFGSNITLANGAKLNTDIDLVAKTSDNFANTNREENGKITISNVNFMNGAKTTSHSINFDLAEAMGLKGEVTIAEELANQTTTFLNPIRYLTGGVTKDGMVSFVPTGNSYKDFNPAILASPIATQLGGYLTQLNSYDEAFRNMDMYMLMTQKQRQALKLKNRFAAADSNLIFDPTMSIHENKAGWFRPYATFENVPLRRGPKVSNVAYGSFFGAESELYDLGHGWDGMWGLYAGYNGSHQAYSGVGIYQNGGTLGAVGMAYKGNFFTGLTINAGANAGEASTMYGNDNFSMFMAGIASKSGYNFEMADSKFIIQPSLQLSYSFVNTFDYTNAAGVKLNSDPLHAIQVEPGVKFIGNLKNNWQPYLGVSMVWNIMDRTHFQANEASLPSLSIKPYVRYGVGVRKTWGERFTAFFQTYFTNGGRNGVGLQTGLRWSIGKSQSSQKKTGSVQPPKKTEIKTSNRA